MKAAKQPQAATNSVAKPERQILRQRCLSLLLHMPQVNSAWNLAQGKARVGQPHLNENLSVLQKQASAMSPPSNPSQTNQAYRRTKHLQ